MSVSGFEAIKFLKLRFHRQGRVFLLAKALLIYCFAKLAVLGQLAALVVRELHLFGIKYVFHGPVYVVVLWAFCR